MDLTDAGMVIEERDVHPLKALSPIDDTVSRTVKDFNLVQSLNIS